MRFRWKELLMFCTEGSPNGVCGVADTIPLDQFPRHRREHVIVFVDALQSLAGKLAFHGECHEELLPHEAQTRCLHGSFRAKKLHSHRSALADSPGPAAGLPQRVQRISRLIEDDGRKVQQIETCFHQLGMADYYLDSVFDLSGVPGLALASVHTRAQHCSAEPFVTQDSLQPDCNVVLLGIHGKDLTPPSLRQLSPDLFDQSAFFGINAVFRKLARICNDKSHPALEFRIKLNTVQRSNPVWVVGL